MRAVALWSLAGLLLGASSCGTADDGENACGTGKVGANGSRESATFYDVGAEVAGCMGSATETHYFGLTGPADVTGGYVQGSVVGSVSVGVYASGTTTEVGHIAAVGPDGPTTFFLAVAPGQAYQLGIANEGPFTKAYDFSLTTSYWPVADTFEPNDDLATASPVVVGTPVQAFLFAGSLGGDAAAAASDDHYRFSATAGALTIRIDNVPPDVAPRLTLLTPDGSELARVASGQKGVMLTLSHTLLAAGELVVRVSPWSAAPVSIGAGVTLPEHFTHPYTLSITQP